MRCSIAFVRFRSRSISIIRTSFDHRQTGIRGKELLGELAGTAVQTDGLLDPALGHGAHPHVDVHVHVAVPDIRREARLRGEPVFPTLGYRIVELQPETKHDAAQQCEARVPIHDPGCQETFGRNQLHHAVPQPQPADPHPLDELSDEQLVLRAAGVAPRLDQVVPSGQGPRDTHAQRTFAGRVFGGRQVAAVPPDHRVQALHPAATIQWQQETIQGRHRRNDAARMTGAEHFVDQFLIDPVEDSQIQKAGALLGRQVLQQPHRKKVGSDLFRDHSARAARGRSRKAIDGERKRPPRSSLQYRIQLAPRQVAIEEPGDFGSRESEFLRIDDDPGTVEDMRCQIEPRIRSESENDMEIARAAPRKEAEQRRVRRGRRSTSSNTSMQGVSWRSMAPASTPI